MQVFFLEENIKCNIFRNVFKGVEIKGNRILLNCNKINKYKKSNINRIVNFVNRFKDSYVVVSRKIKNDTRFMNLLQSNNIKILDGKRLFKINLYNILNVLCQKYSINKKMCKISILTNNNSSELKKLLDQIISEYKSINLVTNHYHLFESLQKNIFNKYGSILYITNNKKKALCNSNIIINIDFPQEMIDKYFVYDNSIILNVEEKVRINKKRFQGRVINDYDLYVKNELESKYNLDRYSNYDIKDVLECFILKNIGSTQDLIINI